MTDNNLNDDENIKLDDDVIIDDNLVENLESEDIEPDTEESKAETSEADTLEEPVKRPKSKSKDKDEDKLNSPELDNAVDEIVAEEADIVLKATDYARAINEEEPEVEELQEKTSFLKSLWKNPKRRWALISVLVISFLAVALIPESRYFILNTAKVRASVELKVIDSSTLQPLKNVNVRVANSEGKTDSEGKVKLTSVKLGKTNLKIEKRAFAEINKQLTVGWGSNPLGDYQVEPVGSKYSFIIKDYLSDKPISKVEASSGEGNAISDDEGKLVLVMDTSELDDSSEFEVDFFYPDYRTEKLKIAVNNKESQAVNMVPDKPHVFVSKRSGKYDVFAIDIDGKNERKILEGEGIERDDMSLVPHPKKNMVAYTATRENVRNSNGYLLTTLYLIDIDKDDVVKIDQSEQIKIVGWSAEGRLTYVKIASGASGTDPKRHRLMSFNGSNYYESSKELATSNSFNDVQMVGDTIYFAPSNIFQENASPAMYSIKPDGTDKKTILDKEVYTIIRSDYDTLFLSVGNEWYEFVVGSPMASQSPPPGTDNNRVYIDNAYGKYSAWVDSRDGKGVLINYDIASNNEKILLEKGGLKYPVFWQNDKNIIFRISDGRETADYALSVEGGTFKKIVDVTDTTGMSAWYYY